MLRTHDPAMPFPGLCPKEIVTDVCKDIITGWGGGTAAWKNSTQNDLIFVMENKKYRRAREKYGNSFGEKVLTMVKKALHKIFPCHLPACISSHLTWHMVGVQ